MRDKRGSYALKGLIKEEKSLTPGEKEPVSFLF